MIELDEKQVENITRYIYFVSITNEKGQKIFKEIVKGVSPSIALMQAEKILDNFWLYQLNCESCSRDYKPVQIPQDIWQVSIFRQNHR